MASALPVDGRIKAVTGWKGESNMPRIRISFSKRGRFCFIRHVELPEIFSRAARRAGLDINFTEGFSPHPKITLGPPLPVGVPGLDEPAEIWFSKWEDGDLEKFRSKLPPGLMVNSAIEVEGKVLSKRCQAGRYFVSFTTENRIENFPGIIEGGLLPEEVMLGYEPVENGFLLNMADPGPYGPGKIVKLLIEKGYMEKWADIRIVRLLLGKWDADTKQVLSLVSGEEALPTQRGERGCE